MDKPLISVLLLSYNNQHLIYECLDSVFKQDYANIELIINDDASENFDVNMIERYITQNKPINITNVMINQSEINVGTVKSLNNSVKKSSGKYYMPLAADDALHSYAVISMFVTLYEATPIQEFVITGKTLMFDENMDEVLYSCPSEKDTKLFSTHNNQQLFDIYAQRHFLATGGNLIPRSYWEKCGGYDEEYKLLEDMPFYAKLLARGVPLHYIDTPTLNHRSGGISHGNKRYTPNKSIEYMTDVILAFENEFIQNSHMLRFRTLTWIKSRVSMTKHYMAYVMQKQNDVSLMRYTLSNPKLIFTLLIALIVNPIRTYNYMMRVVTNKRTSS